MIRNCFKHRVTTISLVTIIFTITVEARGKSNVNFWQSLNKEFSAGAAVSSGILNLTGLYTGFGLSTSRHYTGILYTAYGGREREGKSRWMGGGGAEYAYIIRPLNSRWLFLRPGMAAGYWYNERTGSRSGNEEYYIMPRAGVMLGMQQLYFKFQYGVLTGEDIKNQFNLLLSVVF